LIYYIVKRVVKLNKPVNRGDVQSTEYPRYNFGFSLFRKTSLMDRGAGERKCGYLSASESHESITKRIPVVPITQ